MPLIEPGKKAPAFTLKDQHGKVHRLSDYEGRPVILYFYPKDDRPGARSSSVRVPAATAVPLKPSKASCSVRILTGRKGSPSSRPTSAAV